MLSVVESILQRAYQPITPTHKWAMFIFGVLGASLIGWCGGLLLFVLPHSMLTLIIGMLLVVYTPLFIGAILIIRNVVVDDEKE